MALQPDTRLMTRPLKNDEAPLTLDFVEGQIGTKLPRALLDVLPENGSAIGFAERVDIKPVVPNPIVSASGRQTVFTIFGLNTGPDGIIDNFNRLNGRIFGRAVPIADDGLDNAFVWVPDSGEVLFWHHECAEGEGSPTALTGVSASVSEFFSALSPAIEPSPSELSKGVKSVRLDIF
ncbi:SMI1/KNR4 family protein [Roseobacter weihaiensis]|uniref:SMI1/KNR4 family protein n=1 Tax=Roseobacter weihaiensis TaxID=2763262 RepID=UPI001D0A08FA|nr:SMI1/KNR4 family protein [Roseobacter sp. H9]